ncbi:hypothetical protein TrLO_g3302 [Triparma laevis f. longispina]|uniref:Uncharacterized protein n=1 Tax=Triparma laevis f. longispina TaxID=1714387 RepID=A0A9W7FKG8_9STRA|nr:hypothetical protein TrLO_g3302 [Triparma laevis f. longispina]
MSNPDNDLYSDLPSSSKKKSRFDEAESSDDEASLPSFSAYDSNNELSDFHEDEKVTIAEKKQVIVNTKKRKAEEPTQTVDLDTSLHPDSKIKGSSRLTFSEQKKFLQLQSHTRKKSPTTLTLSISNISQSEVDIEDVRDWFLGRKVRVQDLGFNREGMLVQLGNRGECEMIYSSRLKLFNNSRFKIQYSNIDYNPELNALEERKRGYEGRGGRGSGRNNYNNNTWKAGEKKEEGKSNVWKARDLRKEEVEKEEKEENSQTTSPQPPPSHKNKGLAKTNSHKFVSSSSKSKNLQAEKIKLYKKQIEMQKKMFGMMKDGDKRRKGCLVKIEELMGKVLGRKEVKDCGKEEVQEEGRREEDYGEYNDDDEVDFG